MSQKIFPTAQDCQNTFYESLERSDLDAMMAVWSEDEDIVCVHPAGQRLAGQTQVRDAWRQMFANGPGMRVRITQQVVITTAAPGLRDLVPQHRLPLCHRHILTLVWASAHRSHFGDGRLISL